MLAVGGDAPYCNEKAANLTLCLRVGFVLFRSPAIRGVVSSGHSRCDTLGSQKARSAIRCIKTRYLTDRRDAISPMSESAERHKAY